MSQYPEWRRLQAQKQIFPFLVVPNPLYTSLPTPEPSLSSAVPALQASHLSQSNYRIIDWRAINSPSLFSIPPPHLLICSQTGKSKKKKTLGVTHLIPLGFLYSLQINRGTGTKGLFSPAVWLHVSRPWPSPTASLMPPTDLHPKAPRISIVMRCTVGYLLNLINSERDAI